MLKSLGDEMLIRSPRRTARTRATVIRLFPVIQVFDAIAA
jgi:hypothetical protein